MIQQGIPMPYGERCIIQSKKKIISSMSVISLALCGDVKMFVENLSFFPKSGIQPDSYVHPASSSLRY